MDTKIYSVYEITNQSNRVYVGMSRNVKRRFMVYRCLSCKQQRLLYNSFVKHGVNNHKFTVIRSGLSRFEAEKIEIGLIAFYKQADASLNLQDGGLNNKFLVNGREIFDKIVQLDLRGNLIKTWGGLHSIVQYYDCCITSISNACREGYRTNYAIGFMWQYEKDYLNNRPLKPPSKSKSVVQITLSGVFVREWESASEAGRKLGVTGCSISAAAEYKYNSNLSAGYLWLTKKDYESGVPPRYPRPIKRVVQMDLTGKYMKTWDSSSAISHFYNVDTSTIIGAIRGTGQRTFRGCLWQYEYLYLQGFKKQELWCKTLVYRQKIRKENHVQQEY